MIVGRSVCPTCGRKRQRSSEANNRYWAIVALLMDQDISGRSYGKEAWHAYLKDKFLPSRDMRLPDGRLMTVRASSSDLDVDEFNDYMTKVEAYASETFGVFLPE